MSPDEFEAVVDDVVLSLPEWVREAFDNLVILVEDEAGEALDPEGHGLLGLYTGIPLPERGADTTGNLPDEIRIFRLPHLALGLPDPELREEIARTVMHEIAHYFGIDDDHLEEIGWD